jgi:hypothetical protein
MRRSAPKSEGFKILDQQLLTKASPRAKRQKTSKNFDARPEHLLHNANSALVTVDLREAFNLGCWQLLTPEEQDECLALLPGQDKWRVGESETLKPSFFEHNVVLQDELRTFQQALEQGKCMPGFKKRTQAASRDRIAGKADKFKEAQYEAHWGDKQHDQVQDA